MSQEEEKLIEEFREEDFTLGTTMDGDEISINEPKLIDFILKAYRSGKLAGFGMWEELANKFLKSLFGKKDIHAMAHFTVGYIKSLIEEEKKKL